MKIFDKLKTIINWKSFFIILAGCMAGSLLVMPYQAALSSDIAKLGAQMYLVALIQSALIFPPAIFIGLLLMKKAGFGLPVLEGENKPAAFKSILAPSAVWGAAAGALIILASLLFMNTSLDMLGEEAAAPVWTGFLASFYGGIAEETLFRLCLMSLLVWLTMKIKIPRNIGVWSIIILTGVLFGLGHLPITSALVEITPMIVVRAIVLNSIGSVVFSLLYWKRGLESAMLGHFSADIVLHVITPFIASLFI